MEEAESPADPSPAGVVENHPVEEPAPVQAVPGKKEDANLLKLEDALKRIPEPLRREMEERLRAEFREVRRWQPKG